MNVALKMVESRLNELRSLFISYQYDNYNENNSFHDRVGRYDIFYLFIVFEEKSENIDHIMEFLNLLDTKYIQFDLLKYDKPWIKSESFNPKTYKWQSVQKLHIQAIFDRSKYFDDNKVSVLSNNLKSLINLRRKVDRVEAEQKFKEFD